MKNSSLKTIRLVMALLFFIPLTLFFCDFSAILPGQFNQLAAIQLVPAILAGSWIVLAALILMTVLFGRLYCSVICPLGILQDIISRFNQKGKKKQKAGKKKWYSYSKPQNYLRYSLLGICVLFLVLGIVTPLLILDPYSNFGRIATNLFRPLVMWGNNLLNWVAVKSGNFNFYHVTIYTVTTISLISSIIALLVVAVMSFLKGRLFCNTICPVGSLLGLFSRFSLFRIVMDESKCNSCGSCERTCKSECIDSKGIKVDNSRCVSCFNCLSRCKQDAIHFQFYGKRNEQVIDMKSFDQADLLDKPSVQLGRRTFLATGTIVAASLPLLPAWAKDDSRVVDKENPITPPGSGSLKHFKEKCTACHLCVTHCPQQILKPAGLTFGFGYLLKPHMVYKEAYCNFECDICSKICPNGAIQKMEGDSKKTVQVGIAHFERDRCVVITEGTDCGACSEHCPTQAVKMMPYKGYLRLPEVTPDLCIGCGGCEYICPVRPARAIHVVANIEHKVARKPEEEEIKHFDVEDFGF